MTSTPCVLAFDTKQKERKQFPLRSGKYKLDEVHRALKEMLHAFDKIVEYRNGKNRQSYGHFTTSFFQADEINTWLRDVPTTLSGFLGYKLLPGVATLVGDGLSTSIVTQQIQKLNAFTGQFLSDCDAAHVLLEEPISAEYARLKDGSSDLVWLTQRLKAHKPVALTQQPTGVARAAYTALGSPRQSRWGRTTLTTDMA